MIKIAVVGTGIIGIDHLNAIKSSDKCELVAVCDNKEDVAKEIGERYSVPYFTDYHDILDNVKADAVILNLPHFLHCDVTVYFLEKGVHVLVEKPMANTVEECDRMIEASKKSGKKLAVGHIQRFFESNKEVKKIVESGKLGKLAMFTEFRTIDYFVPTRPQWFLNKKLAGGGIVMNYGAHALDKLFYTLNCTELETVSSVGNIKNDMDIEGHAQMLFKFKNGVSATVTFSGYTNSGYDAVYYFTNGALKVSGSTALSINENGKWENLDVPQDFSIPFKNQLDEFLKYINDEPSDIADGEYGRAIISVIEKVYE